MGACVRTGLVAACIVALMLAAPSADATFPGANGKIAYDGCGPTDCGLFVVNSDGLGAVQLTHNPFFVVLRGTIRLHDAPSSWSADGQKIAYTRQHPAAPYSEIRVVNADGTGDHSLGVSGGQPVWSPDGGKIAFVDGAVEVMNADGTGATQVAQGGDPDWSTDGKIVFSDGSDLYVINPDGSNRTKLTLGQPPGSRWPSWSPDGTKVAFARSVPNGGPSEIYSMNSDGSGVTKLTDNATAAATPPFTRVDDEHPAWSPDGLQILFHRCCPDRLFVMNADGSGQHDLGIGTLTGGAWQPIPNRPPDCSNVTATPGTLWPPNRKLVPLSLSSATDPDGNQVTLTITGVTQDEPTGRKPDAALGPAGDQLSVRAKRSGHGDGRVYRIAFKVTDGRGGECSGATTVGVPRRKNRPAIDSAPPSYDTLVGTPSGN